MRKLILPDRRLLLPPARERGFIRCPRFIGAASGGGGGPGFGNATLDAYNGNLVAVYHMEDASGGLVDTVSGLNLTNDASGTVTYRQSGIHNYAIAFDGASTEELASSAFDLATPALSCWFKWDGSLSATGSGSSGVTMLASVASSSRGYTLWGFALGAVGIGGTANKACLYQLGPGWGLVEASPDVADSAWHHLYAHLDGSNSYFYLDGNYIGTISAPSASATAAAFALSNWPGIVSVYPAGYYQYIGLVDECDMWNTPLITDGDATPGAAAAAALYNAGAGTFYTP
jgi:hypothetical protein